jgi:hypothetical protein
VIERWYAKERKEGAGRAGRKGGKKEKKRKEEEREETHTRELLQLPLQRLIRPLIPLKLPQFLLDRQYDRFLLDTQIVLHRQLPRDDYRSAR